MGWCNVIDLWKHFRQSPYVQRDRGSPVNASLELGGELTSHACETPNNFSTPPTRLIHMVRANRNTYFYCIT